jgi:hypothetical protein
MAEKEVIFTVDEDLWQRAKIEAAIRNIPLRELVAEAIRKEITKVKAG